MNGRVITVTGPVDPAALGPTVTGVHLVGDLAVPGKPLDDGPVTLELLGALVLGARNRDDLRLTEATARAGLAEYAARGGRAVVDVTTPGLGRDPAALARLARPTGVAVVMGCAGPAEEMVADLVDGVDGVRAGVIGRIGPREPDRPADRVTLDGVAAAAAATGAPVLLDRAESAAATHRLLDRLAAGGADLGRVAVGRCDGLATDSGALAGLAGRGAFLQFDGLGRLPTVHSEVDDQDVAAAVLALAERGLAGQVLLSPAVERKHHLAAYGGGGYAFVVEQFLPYLRFRGADDELARTLTVDNPARWLTVPESLRLADRSRSPISADGCSPSPARSTRRRSARR